MNNTLSIIKSIKVYTKSIKTENDESSIKVHQVRYENGGFYQVWKEIFKIVHPKELGNEELKIHEKIVLFDGNIPTDKIIKIPSVTIVIKSLLGKNNKFYLELSLNHLSYKL